MIVSTNKTRRLWTFLRFSALLLLLVIFFLPLAGMVLTSLKQNSELYVYPPKILPKAAQWMNYATALTMINYGKFFVNSVILVVFHTVPAVLASSLIGYGFSRFRVRESKVLFFLMLSTMMIPFMVTVVPLYIMIAKTGMLDRRGFWILWGLKGTPFLIFLFRQYFSTIPAAFEEYAMIEGARKFQIYRLVMFPLVQTAVLIGTILVVQWTWSDYLLPILFLRGDKLTLAVKLARGYITYEGDLLQNVAMAGIVYYTLPIIIVFFALQRRFVAGLLSGGLKG